MFPLSPSGDLIDEGVPGVNIAGEPPPICRDPMPTPPDATEISALPFEKAMQELEDIVAKLENSTVSLDESVRLFERGEALRRRCDALLKEAEARIEKITLGPDGAPAGVAPLDAG